MLKLEEEKGFSLLEVIITIVIAAVVGAMMFQFMGTALIRSGEPVNIVRDEANTEKLMEKVISDYVRAINTNPVTALTTVSGTDYGTEVIMSYIQFDGSGNEQSTGSGNSLKVSIQGTGHKLTTILTKSREDSDDPKVQY